MAVPTPPSGKEGLNKISRWFVLHPYWVLTLAVLATLTPFLAKPFNLDDPLFIWTARQIHVQPCDPYGFDVNWYDAAEPMWAVMENPPLASYYLALAAGIFGWSEIVLHFAFLLPAVAAILGTYRLARHFCDQPMLAAVAALFTPVFLVSATTVMCDALMLAFWVWAVVWWLEGMERDDLWRLGGAGLLIALAELTKYFGACLIPLLAAYGVIEKRRLRLGRWIACLLIPLAALCAYQWFTLALYKQVLMFEAISYAGYAKSLLGVSGIASALTALTFTGGCLAVVVFFAPFLWRARILAGFAGGTILTVVALSRGGILLQHYNRLQNSGWAPVNVQITLWAVGGVSVLALAVADVLDRRDARSWLLASWVLGTFLFTAFFNWTVNARSILPVAPAVGILLVRRLEQKGLTGRKTWSRNAAICLAAGAALALLVTQSDFLLAVAVRQSAQQVCVKYGTKGGTLWYQGHWGFQYYMEALGASPIDIRRSRLKAGEKIALPQNNTTFFQPSPSAVSVVETMAIPGPHRLTTWSRGAGAGFYAATWGPLPFAFNHVPPENVVMYDCLPPPLKK